MYNAVNLRADYHHSRSRAVNKPLKSLEIPGHNEVYVNGMMGYETIGRETKRFK